MNTAAATIQALGVTTDLTPLTDAQLEDWEFITDSLHGIGPIRAYAVTHPERGELGLIFTKGRHCHAEWLMPQAGEYLYAGQGRTLQHALAHILRAHESDGHPVTPADEIETITPAPAPLDPEAEAEAEAAAVIRQAMTERGIVGVVYTGSHEQLQRKWLVATPCGLSTPCPCKGFELFSRTGQGVAEHVGARHLQVTLDQDLWPGSR